MLVAAGIVRAFFGEESELKPLEGVIQSLKNKALALKIDCGDDL